MPEAYIIWIDPDGAWFRMRSPRGIVYLFGPFALTEDSQPSQGVRRAYDYLVSEGWAKVDRPDWAKVDQP